jgi:peptidyl-prolyl cis-trans isomerase D
MLEVIRKRRRSLLIMMAFFAIIVVFVFWGVGPTTRQGDVSRIVARVNGETITVEEYADRYRRQIDYYRNTMGERFSEELLETLNLRQRVIDTLINRVLILKAARSERIRVSKSEVQDAILAMPVFQREGVFDRELYFAVLRQNRIKPGEFERGVEEDIRAQKAQNKVIRGLAVTDEELREAFAREFRKISLEYIQVDTDRFIDLVEVTDTEARGYLERNSSAFMEPTRIKAFYAHVKFDELTGEVKVTDEAVKDYYDKFITEFQVSSEVHARHILIRIEAGTGDSAEAKESARKKAEEILEKVKAGEDFSELAKKYSQDTGSANRGGDLGYFERGVMVKPFEEVAFSLTKGEVSALVETTYGFHIIKVEDIKEARTLPIEEVAEKIKKRLVDEKLRRVAREKMVKLRKTFEETEPLEELKAAASREGAKTSTTGLFSEGDGDIDVELVENPTLKDTAFLLGQGDVSGILEVTGGLYVIKVLERVEEHVPPFEDISSNVKAALKREKASMVAKEKAEGFLERLKEGEELVSLATTEKYTVGETALFSKREGLIKEIGFFVGNNDALFDLKKDAPYYSEVLLVGESFYILKLKDSKEADESKFEEEKGGIGERLMAEKQQEAIDKWIKELRAKADITINEELL